MLDRLARDFQVHVRHPFRENLDRLAPVLPGVVGGRRQPVDEGLDQLRVLLHQRVVDGGDHHVGQVAAAAQHLVRLRRARHRHHVERLPRNHRVHLALGEGADQRGRGHDALDVHVRVIHPAPGEHHLQVLVGGLLLRQADALALEVLDPRNARTFSRDDGERVVGERGGGIIHDHADHQERRSRMPRLEEGGDAHVPDLHLALGHGAHHVGAGVDDLQLEIDAVLLEQPLLHADEHRQVAEVVADDRFQRHRLAAASWRMPARQHRQQRCGQLLPEPFPQRSWLPSVSVWFRVCRPTGPRESNSPASGRRR